MRRFPLLLACIAALASPAAAFAGSLELTVLRDVNAVRAAHGLAPFSLNRQLAAAAAQHSREMAVDGYFAHNSFSGQSFWQRIQHWYRASGYGTWSVGENLLWSSPDVTPRRAVQMWMASPEHKANLLNRRWREVGFSAVHVSRAPGAFGGLQVTILTADFGLRK